MTLQRKLHIAIATLSVAILLSAGALFWFGRYQPEQIAGQFGTPFKLTDDRSQPITEAALVGQPAMLYFGFTRCPVVCPTTLFEMAGWFKTLGPEAKELKAFFFSVDPERDSPELMHNYTSAFTDRITGITGDPAEMQKVIKSWHIYAARVPTDDGDYTMDHTASVMLIDRKGNFKGTISYGEQTEVALAKIRNLIKGD